MLVMLKRGPAILHFSTLGTHHFSRSILQVISDREAVATSSQLLLPPEMITLKLGVKLKSVELTLSKDAGAAYEVVSALCLFAANNLQLSLTQYANEAMVVEFQLGDVNLTDCREESQKAISKIIRG